MAQESKLGGNSPFAKRIVKQVSRLAQGKEDILLLGEPWSGRKMIAFEVHAERGKKKPVVLLDSLSATDVEIRSVIAGGDATAAEASTGRRMAGLTDQATLIVSDIESMAPHNQSLLVSFLKEGRKKYTGLRVFITISQNLIRLAQSGDLSADLIPYLEKFELVEVPPLRQRLEDIPALVHSMTKQYCLIMGKPMKDIDENTTQVLSQGQWPGNIRQLSAVVGKAVQISHGDNLELPGEYLDERQHLTDAIENVHGGSIFILDQSLDLIEKLLIQRALKQFMYNQSKTAQILGLSEANFRYRLKKFGLPSIRQKV
ncbi:MAG: helix-turn-helix domain-containing protein [Bacteroidota bacterium]